MTHSTAVEDCNLNAQAFLIYAYKQIISKIQLRLSRPSILLLNIPHCSLTRANSHLLQKDTCVQVLQVCLNSYCLCSGLYSRLKLLEPAVPLPLQHISVIKLIAPVLQKVVGELPYWELRFEENLGQNLVSFISSIFI